jgi:hypothetical protein
MIARERSAQTRQRPAREGTGTGVSRLGGSTIAKSTVVVWVLVALGVVCGVASAIMLTVTYLIWIAPRKKLLELDLERDAVGVLVYRSVPYLLLSWLILASTSIVVAAKKD